MLLYSAKLWWREFKKKLAAYLLRDTTAYLLEQHVAGCSNNAEINRDGYNPTYWKGKHDGLMVALRIAGLLNISQFKDAVEVSRSDRQRIETFERWQNKSSISRSESNARAIECAEILNATTRNISTMFDSLHPDGPLKSQ